MLDELRSCSVSGSDFIRIERAWPIIFLLYGSSVLFPILLFSDHDVLLEARQAGQLVYSLDRGVLLANSS